MAILVELLGPPGNAGRGVLLILARLPPQPLSEEAFNAEIVLGVPQNASFVWAPQTTGRLIAVFGIAVPPHETGVIEAVPFATA